MKQSTIDGAWTKDNIIKKNSNTSTINVKGNQRKILSVLTKVK